MKEQIQTPYDSRGESKEEKSSKPKSLSRPSISEGLQKPKFDMKWAKANLYRHCSCGARDCRSPSRVYEGNEWYWVYRDKITDEIIEDPSLPRQGGEPGDFSGDDAWEHR